MDKYKIIVSERTYSMLGNHVRFLAKADIEASKRLKSRMMAAIHSLETMPHRYPFLEEDYIPPNKYTKEHVKKADDRGRSSLQQSLT